MRLFTFIFITFITITSCQKDYYLEDLNEANARIEALEIKVSDLVAQGNADKATIVAFTSEIKDLQSSIVTLENELTDQGLINDELSLELAQANESLTTSNDMITELNTQIDVLTADLESAEITAAQYMELIADLEDDLAFEKANIKTVTEYITEVITETEVVTEVQYITPAVANTPAVEVVETPTPEVVDPVITTEDVITILFADIPEADYLDYYDIYTNNDDDTVDVLNLMQIETKTFHDGVLFGTPPVDFYFEVVTDNDPVVCVDTEFESYDSMLAALRDVNHAAYSAVSEFENDPNADLSKVPDSNLYVATITQTKIVDCEEITRDVQVKVTFLNITQDIHVYFLVDNVSQYTRPY